MLGTLVGRNVGRLQFLKSLILSMSILPWDAWDAFSPIVMYCGGKKAYMWNWL